MANDTASLPTGASEAPSLTDREANRQIAGDTSPQAVPDRPADAGLPTADEHRRLPNIGDAHAPTSADDVDDRPDKNLYDRLADKDVTPAA